mgnify:CR=1 FL=1
MTAPILPTLPPARHRVPHWFALCYLGVIVVVSLYPFTDWEDSGQPWLEFLFYPLPYYRTGFDIGVNVLAYLPYGLALARAFRPAWLGVLAAICLGGLSSVVIEITQLYLPMRVASNLDVLCNTGGALLGALLATVPWSVRLGLLLRRARRRWLVADSSADYALMLGALWFLTQINPAIPLFGVVTLPRGLPQPFASPLHDPALFLMLVEAGGAMLHLLALLLFLTGFLTSRRYQVRSVLLFLGIAWFVKVVAAGVLLKPMAFFEWMNFHVALGLVSGLLLAWAATRLRRGWQHFLALLALAGSVWLSSVWPLEASPRDDMVLFRWSYGHLRNLKDRKSVV